MRVRMHSRSPLSGRFTERSLKVLLIFAILVMMLPALILIFPIFGALWVMSLIISGIILLPIAVILLLSIPGLFIAAVSFAGAVWLLLGMLFLPLFLPFVIPLMILLLIIAFFAAR